ncbi:MAG: hypothetical protein HYV33_03270 [Candidatus Kerfeldbacteria bacterium]|nr:hypothetical protein [Candidatus Kerfeldbacteria bacterium]
MNDNRGSVLVITMFILLTIGLMAGVLTAIVVNQLKITVNYSGAAKAYYGAESGIERGLFYAQRARLQKTIGATATADTINLLSGFLSNGVGYQVDATAQQNSFTFNLPEDNSTQFDIFAEDYTDGFLTIVPLSGAKNLTVNWIEQCTTATPPSQLELTLYQWEPTQWEDLTDPAAVRTNYVASCAGTPCQFNLGMDDTHLYRVRLKALRCDLTQGFAQVLNDTFTPLNLTTTMTIESTAFFSINGQRITVQSLWNPPVNSYVDYVLFSEDTITK